MANGNATIIVGSARLGRSIAPFFQRVKSYFIQFLFHTIYNEQIAGDRAHYALASAVFDWRYNGCWQNNNLPTIEKRFAKQRFSGR